jgi:predicted nucleotidyltransferase
MNNLEQITARRDEVLRLAASYGARNVRVFGSCSRGEDRSTSDIDILVKFESGRSLLDHVGLQQDLQTLLGCRVDVLAEGGISPYLQDQILAEALPL